VARKIEGFYAGGFDEMADENEGSRGVGSGIVPGKSGGGEFGLGGKTERVDGVGERMGVEQRENASREGERVEPRAEAMERKDTEKAFFG